MIYDCGFKSNYFKLHNKRFLARPKSEFINQKS